MKVEVGSRQSPPSSSPLLDGKSASSLALQLLATLHWSAVHRTPSVQLRPRRQPCDSSQQLATAGTSAAHNTGPQHRATTQGHNTGPHRATAGTRGCAQHRATLSRTCWSVRNPGFHLCQLLGTIKTIEFSWTPYRTVLPCTTT